MRVDISALLKVNGRSMDIEIDGNPEMFDKVSSDIQKFNKLHLKGVLVNSAGILSFKGNLSFSYNTGCGRCLSEVEQDYTFDVEDVFCSEASLKEEDDYFYTGKELDFSKFILDNIALAIPLKHLCSEHCKGICPECGKDLNKEECSCKDEYIDPRLSKLKDLLK
jgi:uncharacterized protein